MDTEVTNMEYPAGMTSLRPITPHAPVNMVVGGAFAQGPDYTNWRPQGSDDWLLIHTLGGCGYVAAAGRDHRLGIGEVVLFAPGVAQDYGTAPESDEWQLQWVHFKPKLEWRTKLRWPELAPGVGHRCLNASEPRGHLTEALNRMSAISRQPWAGADDLAMNALEEALLWIEVDTMADPLWKTDPRVRRAMNYLAAHLEEPFALAPLAAHSGLSVSRLGHVFKAATGLSPQRYAEELKLREAQHLLAHTGLTVGEVAAAVGYGDALYFSKRFRLLSGLPPTEWRDRQAETPAY